MSSPLVAIVGRPNVGKSTLFNRLVGGRRAIEEKSSGVTRDRIYERASWLEHEFGVMDTGGLTFTQAGDMETEVHKQALLAIDEAQVIIFLVDGREGPTSLDREVANLLHRQGKKVILAVNKIESPTQTLHEFYELGFGEPLGISAAHGLNIGDLLDEIVSFLPEQPVEPSLVVEDQIKVAVVGRPNVGKSSFVNALLGEARTIVSAQPGTTRDSIDSWIEKEGTRYRFIDTAGIRRKSRVKENLEYYSVMRSLRAIEQADIALLLLDAQEGVTVQDQKIAGYILDQGKALVLALNKWDLVEAELRQTGGKEAVQQVRGALKFVSFAPVVFTSIYELRRLHQLFKLFPRIYENYTRRIPTPLLNRLLEDAQGVNPMPSSKGKQGRIYYWTQTTKSPPTFLLFVNDPALVHFSYLRYLENRLREAFDFAGTPLKFHIKSRSRKGDG